jgi:branched-subunit amino acid aminotransferase/4-amino-4-deoxychorismate lyase
MIIYLDGKFVPKEEAVVSIFDHGLLYGDGVFEGIRAYHGRVFKLEEHLERLYESAKSIMLEIPVTIEEMQEIVLETLRRNKLRDAYIRLVVTRGVGDVASSRISIGGSFKIVLAIDKRCFSPPESFKPRLPTNVSYLSGSDIMKS